VSSARGLDVFAIFINISLYILETVQDKDIVTMEDYHKIICVLSIGDIASNLE